MLLCVLLEFIHFHFYMAPHCINISTLAPSFAIDGHVGCFQFQFAFLGVCTFARDLREYTEELNF